MKAFAAQLRTELTLSTRRASSCWSASASRC